ETGGKMERIAEEGKNISVRTREADGTAKLVMKASVGDDSSENGVARLEIEETIPAMSFQEMDELVRSAGYEYQAKWSRVREEYSSGPFSICLDKNAGYGYLAEIERVVEDVGAIEGARTQIADFMRELGITELPQDRLERMFAHYNAHWPEY